AEARARLVEAYPPLVAAMARTDRGGRIQRLELLHDGVVGVLGAHYGLDDGEQLSVRELGGSRA
ncbi:MAG TPA: hypothetical protein VFR97_01320, partial [Capillimicrobium sp.]|nr:hypothetical protein [Capillimicrobium sp.]